MASLILSRLRSLLNSEMRRRRSSGRFLRSSTWRMMLGTALVSSSTTATLAATAVLDRGLRSMASTVFPAAARAAARSPSSRGIRTTSARPMPSAEQLARSDAIPSRRAACSSVEKTCPAAGFAGCFFVRPACGTQWLGSRFLKNNSSQARICAPGQQYMTATSPFRNRVRG